MNKITKNYKKGAFGASFLDDSYPIEMLTAKESQKIRVRRVRIIITFSNYCIIYI
jgi:hypothetical protein